MTTSPAKTKVTANPNIDHSAAFHNQCSADLQAVDNDLNMLDAERKGRQADFDKAVAKMNADMADANTAADAQVTDLTKKRNMLLSAIAAFGPTSQAD